MPRCSWAGGAAIDVAGPSGGPCFKPIYLGPMPERVLRRAVFAAMLMRPAIRFLGDPAFRVRVIRFLLGKPTPLESPDRTVLETIIFPYFQCLTEVHSVLFVGCDWYTRHYESAYFAGKDFWTIDPAPRARKFAGRQHLVAPLEELGRHFPPERFDLIVCNGVFGYGLNDPCQCEQAFRECHSRLRARGYLVMGWDDTPARTPVPMPSIRSLTVFEKFAFPPLGSWRYTTDTAYRHTYDFYRRTARSAVPARSSA